MGTTAASTIDRMVHQNIGDWVEVVLTTALTTSNDVISTNLNEYDEGKDDHFNERWVYITDKANLTKDRKIYDYETATGKLDVRGANFISDGANLATVRVYRYSYTNTIRAINDAIRELSSHLFKYVDDRSLLTGDVLWDRSFEYWTSATALTFWTSLSGAQAQTTTAGLYRGQRGSTSVKYTAGAASDYLYQTSTTNLRLLDLMGKTVSIYVWAYPQTTDDATITIYTLQADGTAQTLASTTACPSGKWTLLKLENQTLNDDLVTVQLRLGVATNAQYAYFDNCRITGGDVNEYLLPESLQDGDICQVYVQDSGNADEMADDIMPEHWTPAHNFETFNDGTYRFIKIPHVSDERQIRLVGTSPLTELSTFSGTTEVDGKYLNLLVAYSCYCLFRNEMGVASSSDTKRLEDRRDYWWAIAHAYMNTLKMTPPKSYMNIG